MSDANEECEVPLKDPKKGTGAGSIFLRGQRLEDPESKVASSLSTAQAAAARLQTARAVAVTTTPQIGPKQPGLSVEAAHHGLESGMETVLRSLERVLDVGDAVAKVRYLRHVSLAQLSPELEIHPFVAVAWAAVSAVGLVGFLFVS